MNIHQVNASINTTTTATGGRFYLPGATEFANSLNLGEIIKGKVLRHYEGTRYQVSFNGQERVVDSAMPLRTGELIHGRVIAVNDRVELQRVYPQEHAGTTPTTNDATLNFLSGRTQNERIVDTLFSRYQAKISETDRAALLKTMRSADAPDAMAMVGLAANKLGLGQSAELLNSLYRAYVSPASVGNGNITLATVIDDAATQLGSLQAQFVKDLAVSIRQSMDALKQNEQLQNNTLDGSNNDPATTHQDANTDLVTSTQDNFKQASQQNANLAQWVLNAQQDGMVAHRLGSVPMLINGKLMEVDIAMFEQQRDKGTDQSNPVAQTHHRQIVFSMTTDKLGRVEMRVKLSGDHLRVQVTSDQHGSTAELTQQADVLSQSLRDSGWIVDELMYQTQRANEMNSVVASVVEHIVSQDSLNRLI